MESWADRIEGWHELDLRQKMLRIAEVIHAKNAKKAREIMRGRPEWASSKVKQERKYWLDMEESRKEINKLVDEIERQKKDLFKKKKDDLLKKKDDLFKKKKDDLVRNAKKNRKRFVAFLRKEKKHSIARDPARHTVKLLQKYKNQRGGRRRRKTRRRKSRRKTRRRQKLRKH